MWSQLVDGVFESCCPILFLCVCQGLEEMLQLLVVIEHLVLCVGSDAEFFFVVIVGESDVFVCFVCCVVEVC